MAFVSFLFFLAQSRDAGQSTTCWADGVCVLAQSLGIIEESSCKNLEAIRLRQTRKNPKGLKLYFVDLHTCMIMLRILLKAQCA